MRTGSAAGFGCEKECEQFPGVAVVVGREVEQGQGEEEAGGHAPDADEGGCGAAGSGQAGEPGRAADGELGDDREGQVARGGGAVEPGDGLAGRGQGPEPIGQGRVRLDGPLDGQAVGRIELVVEVGGEE